MRGRVEAERSQTWCRCRLPTVLPELGEKQDPWEEQEKSFLTQTRVLGHATPSQCLVMQNAEMETVAPQDHGAVAPTQGSPLGASRGACRVWGRVGTVSMSLSMVG